MSTRFFGHGWRGDEGNDTLGNHTVSSDTDRRVRRVLEAAGRKGDLSKFVEEAVKARLLDLRMRSLPLQSNPSANDVQPVQIDDEDDERQYGG